MKSLKDRFNPKIERFFYCRSCNKVISIEQINRGAHLSHLLNPAVNLSFIERVKNVLGMYE